MKDLGSRAQGSICPEQCTTLGLKLRVLDALNSYRLWLAWINLDRKLWALYAMNNSRLSMTLPTLGHEPALDAMNNFRLWLT